MVKWHANFLLNYPLSIVQVNYPYFFRSILIVHFYNGYDIAIESYLTNIHHSYVYHSILNNVAVRKNSEAFIEMCHPHDLLPLCNYTTTTSKSTTINAADVPFSQLQRMGLGSCQELHARLFMVLVGVPLSQLQTSKHLLNKSSLLRNWILKMSLQGDLGPRPLNVDLVSCLWFLYSWTFSRKLSQATTSLGSMMRRIQSLSHLGVQCQKNSFFKLFPDTLWVGTCFANLST